MGGLFSRRGRFLNWLQELCASPTREYSRTFHPKLEMLENRIAMAAIPEATLAIDSDQVLIGEEFTFTVTFDNRGDNPGIGPYVDLYFPVNGADGVPDAESDDGISFVGATFLGQSLTYVDLTFDANGQILHPYAVDTNNEPIVVSGTPGDHLIVLQLPFSSFADTQTPAVIEVTAMVSGDADVMQPLTIQAGSGFRYGNDALNNPDVDPTIYEPSSEFSSITVTPEVMVFRKEYLWEENETVTGPNYPRTYRIVVDIADGQEISNLQIQDFLDDNMAYLGVVAGTAGYSVDQEPALGSPHNPPFNELRVSWSSPITGTSSDSDAFIEFEFFISEEDAGVISDPVLDPVTGNFATSTDDAVVQGDWTPTDPRDAPTTVILDVATNSPGGDPAIDHILTDKSIAVQKHVTNVTSGHTTAVPDDILEYDLDFQISDYFTFDNVVITDIFSDGQALFTGNYVPYLFFSLAGSTYNFDFVLNDNMFVVANADGTTTVTFNVSDLLADNGIDAGLLVGDLAADPLQEGGTFGTVFFQTQINDAYDVDFPSGDASLNEHDLLSNSVTIAGDVVDNDTLIATGSSQTDTSYDEITIAAGSVTKSVYAVNGSTSLPSLIRAGDAVTYRITYNLTTGDFEDFSFTDFLPLPIFVVSDPNADGTPALWLQDTSGNVIPVSGTWKFGPNNTITDVTPTVYDAANRAAYDQSNSLPFFFGTRDDADNAPDVLDILFTITATDAPLPDGLHVTNEVTSTTQNTNNETASTSSIIEIQVAEPIIDIYKGIVGYNDTGLTLGGITFADPASPSTFSGGPIDTEAEAMAIGDSDLTGGLVDAGDTVRTAIVVQNTGHSDAFDVTIEDSIPAGYEVPASLAAMNLIVRRGDGTLLVQGVDYTATLVGGDLSITLVDNYNVGQGIGGINQGLDDSDNPVTDGSNTVVITYDLVLADDVEAGSSIVNTATVSHYAAVEGGDDFTFFDPTDDALVDIADVVVDKTIVGTNQSFTSGTDVAIGELITYQVVVTIPEGHSSGVTLVDTMDAGLALVSLDSLIGSAGVTTDFIGGFAAVLANAVVTNSGGRITFDFGNMINAVTNDNLPDTVTLTYTVAVLNSSTNNEGTQLNNHAVWTTDEGGGSDNAPNVTIVEQHVTVTSDVTPGLADADDVVTYTVVVTNTGSIDAFNVDLSTFLLPQLVYVDGTFSFDSGSAPDAIDVNELSASWDTLAIGETATFTFQATLADTVYPGESLTETSTVTWTSLPGDVTTTQSTYNALAVERTGDTADPGSTANDYVATDDAEVLVPEVALVKRVMDTSESATLDDQVAVGEIVRYRLIVGVREGISPNMQIIDMLPTGMVYLQDFGSTLVAFVSSGGDMTSSNPDFDGAQEIGNFSTIRTIVPRFAFPDSGLTINGNEITFNFGDVTNNDSDPDFEYIILEFNALVTNVDTNVDGTLLDNTAEAFVDAVLQDTSNTASVVVVEPQINNVEKYVTGTDGTTVDFEVTYSNTGTATAFNSVFTDDLPPGLTLLPSSVEVDLGSGASGSSFTTGGNSLVVNVDAIPVGGTVTLRYSVTVAPGSAATNTALVTYTSLTGTGTSLYASSQGTPGDTDGERTGDGATNGSDTVNLYFDADTAGLNTVGDFVWFDANQDGNQDPGEPGLANITVTVIWSGVDGILDTTDDVAIITATDSTGFYQVSGIPEGEVRIVVDTADPQLPAGLALGTDSHLGDDTEDGVTQLTFSGTGIAIDDVDFGFVGTGSLGDTVWFDQNNNGVFDANEYGIDGVTVRLTWAGQDGVFGNADDYETATTTSGGGLYQFIGLAAGSYRVAVDTSTLPAATNRWESGYDITGGNDSFSQITLNGGQARVDVDFGFYGKSSLGDTVWFDQNNDGVQQAGEPGLAGITVNLQWAGENGTFGDSDDFFTSTVTDASGNYLFDRLLPGEYRLDVDQASLPSSTTWITGYDIDGGLDASSDVTLANEEDRRDVDFAFYGTGSIGDTVWFDVDNNGSQDAGEPGLNNVRVVLEWAGLDGILGTSDDASIATFTDSDGHYQFDNLAAGLYRVNVSQDLPSFPRGLTNSNDAHPDDILANGVTLLTLADGATDLEADFGYTGTGAIGDYVWNDYDSDGIQDLAEPGIPGVTVNLTWAGQDAIFGTSDDVDYSTETGSLGRYLFRLLPAGRFRVSVDTSTLPAGLTAQTAGGDPQSILLSGGEVNLTADFGYAFSGTLGDRIWLDVDRDGVQDVGEPGLPSVRILVTFLGDDGLAGTGDEINYTIVSDSAGMWLLPAIPTGSYIVNVLEGTAPSNVVLTTADNLAVTLLPNLPYLDADFGFWGDSSLSGTILANRQPMVNRQVILVWSGIDSQFGTGNELLLSTFTNTNGFYAFSGLPSGLFMVIQPAGVPQNMVTFYDYDGGNDARALVTVPALTNVPLVDFRYQQLIIPIPIPFPPSPTPLSPQFSDNDFGGRRFDAIEEREPSEEIDEGRGRNGRYYTHGNSGFNDGRRTYGRPAGLSVLDIAMPFRSTPKPELELPLDLLLDLTAESLAMLRQSREAVDDAIESFTRPWRRNENETNKTGSQTQRQSQDTPQGDRTASLQPR